MGMLLSRPASLYRTDDKQVEITSKPAEFVAEAESVIYTKTDINRMSKDALTELAKEKGIDNADELSGMELKKMLIEML